MKLKLWLKILCCTLSIVTLALHLPLEITESKAAPTNSEIQKLEEELRKLEENIKEYEGKIEDIKKNSSSAMNEKAAYEEQIALVESKIESTESLIAEYDRLIAENESSVEDKNEEYDKMFEKVKERLRIRYESGVSNQLVYILEAESFTEFLVNMERTADILRYDRELMAEITAQKESLNTDRELLEKYKSEQENAKKSLDAEKDDLDDKKANLNNYINQLENDQEKYEQMLLEAEEADKELNAQLEAALAALAAKTDEVVQHPVDKDSLIWPVSTTNKLISSYYGERNLWGRKSFHYGIDIPAPAGSNVYAAQSGVVVYSQYHYSYGNFVVLNHGGGYTTLYAHNTSNAVSVGQTVSRGDVIAYVGTTGTSSGNHCHFEVRVNGAHTNPLNYVNQP